MPIIGQLPLNDSVSTTEAATTTGDRILARGIALPRVARPASTSTQLTTQTGQAITDTSGTPITTS